MPEVVDMVVLHGGSLCLPLGSEGDTGSPLVHGLTTATGLTGSHPESEVIRVLQSYKTTMAIKGLWVKNNVKLSPSYS